MNYPFRSLAELLRLCLWLEPLEKILVGLSVSRLSWNKVAARVCEDDGVLKYGEVLPAHAVGDDSVVQSKHMQGGDLQGSAVEYLMFLARAVETSNEDGKAEVEVRL